MFQVLIICTGNTCRSPMAEGIWRSLPPSDLGDVTGVVSAGTGATEGAPATHLAVEVCAAGGADISSHRSIPVTRGLIRASDLVLGMEPQHVAYARDLASDAADRIHLITEKGAAPGSAASEGVLDPIGGRAGHDTDTFKPIPRRTLGIDTADRGYVESTTRLAPTGRTDKDRNRWCTR